MERTHEDSFNSSDLILGNVVHLSACSSIRDTGLLKLGNPKMRWVLGTAHEAAGCITSLEGIPSPGWWSGQQRFSGPGDPCALAERLTKHSSRTLVFGAWAQCSDGTVFHAALGHRIRAACKNVVEAYNTAVSIKYQQSYGCAWRPPE